MCRLLAEPVCVCVPGRVDTMYILQRVVESVCRQNNVFGGGGVKKERERERKRERRKLEREREGS